MCAPVYVTLNARPPGSVTVAKGAYEGPQLSGVSAVTNTDSFGDFDNYEVTFTFDMDIDDVGAVTGFSFFYDEDGETLQTDLDDCEVDDDNTVVCVDEDEDSDLADAAVFAVDAGSVQAADAINFGGTDLNIDNPEASFAASLDSNS